ncbi:hypothetical protein ACIGZJ_30890 [Kitasatospora sp. NPDC052868]|uniref:hypothetical protein n=1 Tax=Kitasatospora sp. NPDC052868 TaxID=3364060 RepID=UPI0037C8B3EA
MYRRTRYDKELRLDHARGRRRTAPADPVRARLRELRATGATWRQISEATGVAHTRLMQLAGEVRPVLWTSTAEKILAVRPERLGLVPARCPALGAVRRIQALMAIGHYGKTIAAASGLCPQTLSEILNGRYKSISSAHHEAVATAYNALWSVPGSSVRSLIRARAGGWAGPLQWDDEALDDPAGTPDWTGHCGSGSGWLLHAAVAQPPCGACGAFALNGADLGPDGARALASAASAALLVLGRRRCGWRGIGRLLGMPESRVLDAYELAKQAESQQQSAQIEGWRLAS